MNKRTINNIKELIVYIAKKCSSDDAFGVTKLNKILFYADSYHYLETGKTITGANYLHMERGPMIEQFYEIMDDMDKKDIALAHVTSGPFTQQQPVALRNPKLSSFDPEMISTLDEVLGIVTEKKIRAKWLSEGTHDLMGWIATVDSEVIPFETFYLKPKTEQRFNSWESKKVQEISAQQPVE